jgi:hypothetical protein
LLAIYIYSCSNSFIGLSFTPGHRNRVGRGAIAAPDFGWSINPIPTREADYAHHITNAPPPPQDFQTFLLPYTLSMFSTLNVLIRLQFSWRNRKSHHIPNLTSYYLLTPEQLLSLFSESCSFLGQSSLQLSAYFGVRTYIISLI